MSQETELKFQILDTKNEIERVKLTISSLKLEISCCYNKTKISKLNNKRFYMERRLRQLNEQRIKLEKQHNIILKTTKE
jgi:hypothetical protein